MTSAMIRSVICRRRDDLSRWRNDLQSALNGELPDHPIWPAIVDIIRRFDIPVPHLTAVIDGVEMDLTPHAFATFPDLSNYCYHVAGAVGLCCIRVWGCRDEAAVPFAVECGLAFQLTNILRDLAEDADQGRIYLPEEDLQRFGYTADDLRRRAINQEFRNLMAFETERAWFCYRRAEHLMAYLPPPGRRVLRIMREIYGGLLHEIERRDFDVYTRRVHLPAWKKCWITARALLGKTDIGN